MPLYDACAKFDPEYQRLQKLVNDDVQKKERRVTSEVQLLMAMFNLVSDEARQRFVDWLEEPQEEGIKVAGD